jgi:dihydrolipoamide dehydrogenase
VRDEVDEWLDARAWTTGDGPKALFDAAAGWLRERRVLLPGASRLARLVASVREAANQRLWDTLYGLLNTGPRKSRALARPGAFPVQGLSDPGSLWRWGGSGRPTRPSSRRLRVRVGSVLQLVRVDPIELGERGALRTGGTETVTFGHCIIAAGATTRLLPGTSLSERVVTYEEQILTDSLPQSIIIAGAGAIGVEFAYVLHNYGVKVTIIEFLDRVVPLEDAEVSTELAKRYRRLGIEILTSTRVESIDDSDPAAKVRVTVSRQGQEQVLEADKVLQAIGFAPRVTGYGLENTGVRLTERGAIDVDGRGRTNVPHIFAVGDVTAKLMLAHAAESMAVIAAETIADAETMELDFVMIPRATYCQPQIASFGWTEAQAREKGYDVKVVKFPFTANGKAHGLGDPVGFVKVISDGRHGELLGAHLIGPEVTELLPELTLAQQWDLTVHEVARNVHAHPTLGEAVKEAIHGLAGHMINM